MNELDLYFIELENEYEIVKQEADAAIALAWERINNDMKKYNKMENENV